MQCLCKARCIAPRLLRFLGFTDFRTHGAERLSPPCGRDSSVNMLLTRNCGIFLTARTWKTYKIDSASGSP